MGISGTSGFSGLSQVQGLSEAAGQVGNLGGRKVTRGSESVASASEFGNRLNTSETPLAARNTQVVQGGKV